MKSKRAAPKVPFGTLIETGWIKPGTVLTGKKGAIVRPLPPWCARMARWFRTRLKARSIPWVRNCRARPAATAGPSGTSSMRADEALDAIRQLYLLANED
jgi:modification methylase